jgi:hypothetical protein
MRSGWRSNMFRCPSLASVLVLVLAAFSAVGFLLSETKHLVLENRDLREQVRGLSEELAETEQENGGLERSLSESRRSAELERTARADSEARAQALTRQVATMTLALAGARLAVQDAQSDADRCEGELSRQRKGTIGGASTGAAVSAASWLAADALAGGASGVGALLIVVVFVALGLRWASSRH